MYTKVIIDDLQVKDNSKSSSNYHKQLEVKAEINKHVVNINRDEFKKTLQEKIMLKQAKLNYSLNKFKNSNEILSAFVHAKTPNWGGFSISGKDVLIVCKPQ